MVRDCSQDADKTLLRAELEKEISQIIKRYENKMLKCTLDYFFMSHYHYDPEKFQEEAGKLGEMLTVKAKSSFNNYQE